MDKEYRMCRRCIMDTSDPTITFDSNGVCNHCHFFDSIVNNLWLLLCCKAYSSKALSLSFF